MALLVKNYNPTRKPGGYEPVLDQWIKTSRATDTLPATATETIFTVTGGRIWMRALIGEVTTAIQAQACNLSVSVDSDAHAAVTMASTVDINADAVGNLYVAEGDGTALVSVAGGYAPTASGGAIIAPGIITITTSATNTGSVKWDLYWLPLDRAASVVAAAV